MSDLIRDAPLGQIIRFVTRKRYLKYPEEEDDWQCPDAYQDDKPEKRPPPVSSASSSTDVEKQTELEKDQPSGENHLTTTATQPDVENVAAPPERSLSRVLSSPRMSHVNTQESYRQAHEDALRQETIKQEASRPLTPERTANNQILVTWYTTDDPANPQNWSQGKKALVILQIYMYTLAVYIAAAIYTPGEPEVIEKFGITQEVAGLGLSMYVLGYGTGPLLFSPMSEIPIIGRNPPYIITFFIYLMITIPLALVNNWPAFVVLRYFQGFFGSPALATGGASITDIYSLMEMPYLLTGWAGFATAGPSLGPLLAGFSVPVKGWHWTMWEVLWLGAPIFVSLMICLPETSGPTILLNRARRLRKRMAHESNDPNSAPIVAQSEIDQANMSVGDIARENIIRPFQINILDPSVLFTSLYIGLIYGIFYSFFEMFPLVYGPGLPGSITHGYGFNIGEQGLIFLSITVGVSISIAIYIYYLYYHANPKLRAMLAKGQFPAPEGRLTLGLYASLIAPACLFWFAWTGFNSPKIHWIVPTLAIVVFVVAVFILFQVIFIYLALTYPQYSASLFAFNDFARSSIAAGAIHFSTPMFHNLGIGRGGSLLGGLMVMGIIGIWTLWYKGAWLRSKSRFAAK